MQSVCLFWAICFLQKFLAPKHTRTFCRIRIFYLNAYGKFKLYKEGSLLKLRVIFVLECSKHNTQTFESHLRVTCRTFQTHIRVEVSDVLEKFSANILAIWKQKKRSIGKLNYWNANSKFALQTCVCFGLLQGWKFLCGWGAEFSARNLQLKFL